MELQLSSQSLDQGNQINNHLPPPPSLEEVGEEQKEGETEGDGLEEVDQKWQSLTS